ncbi:MAG: patatin [Deltaproteobacteria bacterium]|nr:MAG: patatin [Deltaproteobacteria bacterium]
MKRILALDGGGIHGLFSVQILARVEQLFRAEYGKPELVLGEVFDLFAGTSTGAIIATCLSWGMTVDEIEDLYVSKGRDMFVKEPLYRRWKAKYRPDAIAGLFRDVFSEDPEHKIPSLLGTSRLKTLLLIVMRNASTGSPWPVSNNPGAKFNDRTLPDCNLDIPLWQLLRASTAAPTYFAPEEIHVGGQQHMFVDGGITPFNNPALIAVLMATLPAYKLSWPATPQSLHVLSVGTGTVFARLPDKIATRINLLDQLEFVIPALLGSISVEQDLICRLLGDCVHGASLDSELQALDTPTLFEAHQQKFTYVRYDRAYRKGPGAIELSPSEAQLDNLRLIPWLQQTGRQYAAENVRREHLFPRQGIRAL